MPTQAEKQRLLAEIKQLKQQHDSLQLTHQKWTASKKVIQRRLDEIEDEQLKINVAIWRAENEAGIEQLIMF